jgi:CheY-like chemotaxis protein
MNALKEILIVDDEPGYRFLINKELKTAGYHTVLAQNGEEALVALWEKQHIGLVLLDVRLPVINGLNIFEIIRKDFPDKKIIVSSVLQKDEQRFLIYDADDYYDKSEDLSTLIEKIDHNLSNPFKGRLSENEKRYFRRMPVNVLANCEWANQYPSTIDSHFLSYTKDLSPLGGRFIVGEDVKVGQRFMIALEIPVNFLPLLIDCEVIWVRKLEESDTRTKVIVEVGARFIKLDSPRDEEKLKNYLNCV